MTKMERKLKDAKERKEKYEVILSLSSYYLANYPTEVESAFTAEELAQIGSVSTFLK